MKLSPLEIKKQEFARAFRGYDTEEVQAFLQMMSSQWESLLEENRRLEEQVRDYKNKIEHYEKVEEALQDALETARETAKEKVENAEQRAQNTIEEAEQKAEQIRDEAHNDRYAMKREVSKLKHRREEIVARLRAFLMSEMEMLAQYEEEDPIGFIKFLPQRGEEGSSNSDPIEGSEESMETTPPRKELIDDGPEAPRDKASKLGQDLDEAREDPEVASMAEEARETTDPSGRSSFSARESSEGQTPGEQPVSRRQEPRAEEEDPEKKQRWRVHSVVSSPPGSKGSSKRGAQARETNSPEPASEERSDTQSQEERKEAASSEEMEKIRRILDELE